LDRLYIGKIEALVVENKSISVTEIEVVTGHGAFSGCTEYSAQNPICFLATIEIPYTAPLNSSTDRDSSRRSRAIPGKLLGEDEIKDSLCSGRRRTLRKSPPGTWLLSVMRTPVAVPPSSN
jgi:hypothetical protein